MKLISYIVVVCILVITILITGCTSGSNSLEGKYVYINKTQNYQLSITFYPNGTFLLEAPIDTASGQYTINGNTLLLKQLKGPTILKQENGIIKFRISENEIIRDQYKQVFVKQ